MDREIPSVPITTLAGVASLTDLLPEMPLPSPLLQTLSNKSLLFHPRVAEEAQNLLGTREHALIPQLVHSLLQSSTDYIELKDHYASTEQHVDQQQCKPELLQAILEKNPNVFNHGPQVNVTRTHQQQQQSALTSIWNHTNQVIGNAASVINDTNYLSTNSSTNPQTATPSSSETPGGVSQLSPQTQCGQNRHTPQGSPASPASACLPLVVPTVVPHSISSQQAASQSTSSSTPTSSHRPSVITEQVYHHRNTNNTTPNSEQQQQTAAPSSSIVQGNYGHHHQSIAAPPTPLVSSSRNQLMNCTNDQVPTPTTLLHHPPSIDSSYLSGTQTSSSSCSSTETLGFTTPSVTTQHTTIVDGSHHHQQGVSINHPDYTSFHHNSSQVASSSTTSSATNNNLEQDFEQVLPVQRIQTVNALYATSETNRVPLNNPPQSSSTSSTDTSIIKAPQHNTQYSVGCYTQTPHTQISSASHDLVNSNHVTTTPNPTYPTYYNNTSTIDNNTVSRRSITSAISTTSASVVSTIGGAISSNVSERETRQDHVIKPMNIRGPSPAQASDAPAAPSTPISFSTGEQSYISSKPSTATNMPQPVVRLNRITQEDQALMQRSISEFAENRPQLASKLGITTSNQGTDESDQDDVTFEPKTTRRGTKRITDDSKDDNITTPHQTDSFTSLINVRKRKINAVKEAETSPIEVPKPKLRKVERRFVPVLEKLSIEELMETNTYVRFSRSIDNVLKNVDETYSERRNDDDVMLSEEPLISRYQLQEVCSEAAKLKTLGAMHMIPADRLVRLLNLLEESIRGGDRISPLTDPDDNEDIRQMWMETAMERVMSAVDASLTCMYVMTSTNMSKRVYLEDTIDRVILFIKYQLHNTIFPSFDSVYRVTSKKKVDNRKRNSRQHTSTQVREKSIVQLYNKIHELVALLAELLQLQTLTDTTVLHASSMGVAPFFVDNVSELQLSSLKLVTTIFTRYENHRRLLLDDILSSIARLPSSKRGLRSYRLLSDTEEYIQMLTALVLQLIQCVVALPETLSYENKDKITNDSNTGGGGSTKAIDKDILIHRKYETAKSTAGTFLTVFLGKCGNKNEEIDYRPLFENFVQDLLTTVNKPEWPASEMLLSLLGIMLVSNFTNKSLDATLRVASLDYLGVIAARLRKDAVTSSCKLETIDQMIKDIKNEEIKDGDEDNSSSKSNKQPIKFNSPEEERTHFLQRVLLDYLAVNGQKDQAHRYARHFYLVQWYRDAISDKKTIANQGNKQSDKSNSKKSKSKQASSDDSGDDSEMDEPLNKLANNTTDQNELYRQIEDRKKFYISKIRPFQDNLSAGNRVQVLQTYIDYKSAELISQYLASKRSFSQSFDQFLKHILIVLRETSIAIRTKAMKCLTMIVEADSSVLARADMQIGVKHSLLDHSTSVREAAVDLVGKFVLSRPELIDKYYNMLLARILDTGVSVRKRVIKILKDICIECPQFHKIPEICVKMIRRVNDEEGIKKLVMEVFQNMWFTPTPERQTFDSDILLRKVMNIIDVVASSKDMGIEWFEMLLISLFKPREDKDDSTKVVSEPPKSLLTACRQIVDCLIENVLRLEEGGQGQEGGQAGVERLVACLITLYLFAKIRPQLLVKHASTLQPYLSYKCQTKLDHQIVSYVAQTLELVVPLIIHPSETFLAQLEEDAIKLILQSDRPVVSSCIACLSSIVNNVTRNYKLIRDCFNKYYGHLCSYKQLLEKDLTLITQEKYKPTFRRSMFTVGLLLRHFDFTDKDVIRDLPSDIKDQVFNTLTFYLHLDDKNIQANTLMAIGSVCVRHYDFMLLESLKQFYHSMLVNTNSPLEMKTEVLRNIEAYLMAEEMRMIKQDQEWAKRSKDENLKEMGDVSSGMASTVIQLYLKEILQSFIHPNIVVRHTAMRVIQLILQQGLVHPVQIVPYLICMSTDEEKIVSHCADKQLQDIEKKYPGFIHMKSQFGIRLSNQLQRIIQTDEIVRGYRIKEKGEPPTALNGFLYSILRNTKQQRRAIAISILKQFDEHNRTTLSYMLYLADNLAYFPFQVQDEPLFIIHHIDIMISVSGTNLLQSFREALLPINGFQQPSLQQNLQELQLLNQQNESSEHIDSTQFSSPEKQLTDSISSSPLMRPPTQITPPSANSTLQLHSSQIIDDFDEEDEADILARLPEDTQPLQSCITAAQGCLLLLVLKQHLKDTYGISDSKITQYSPSETAKVYEKAVTRKSNSLFNPKATLTRLKQGSPPSVLDEVGRKDLVSQYVDFKQLMIKLDPDDDDDEDTPSSTNSQNRLGGNATVVNNTSSSTNTSASSTTLSSTQSGQISTDQLSTSELNTTSSESPNKSFQSSYNSTSQLQEKDPLGDIPNTPVINLTKDSLPRVPKLVISNRRPIATVDLTSDNNSKNRSRSHRPSEKLKKSRTKRKRKKILASSGSDSDDFSDPDFLA